MERIPYMKVATLFLESKQTHKSNVGAILVTLLESI